MYLELLSGLCRYDEKSQNKNRLKTTITNGKPNNRLSRSFRRVPFHVASINHGGMRFCDTAYVYTETEDVTEHLKQCTHARIQN